MPQTVGPTGARLAFSDGPLWTGAAADTQRAAFQTCELCSYDFRTDEGERGCHYYGCPSLPEALDVWCPRYSFMIADGNPACGDTPRCEFARTTAPVRVAALEEWLRSRGR